jgi:hypothetical protein
MKRVLYRIAKECKIENGVLLRTFENAKGERLTKTWVDPKAAFSIV